MKPYRCEACDLRFKSPRELVRHVRYRHTFEKPHKCPRCEYSSVELSKLKRHVRSIHGSAASRDAFRSNQPPPIHAGETFHECDICHRRFAKSKSMKTHR